MPTRLAVVLALTTAGCALTDPEEAVTIEQGVYGLTESSCDHDQCEDGRYANALVYVQVPGQTDYIMTKSDEDGFFEIELPAGTYRLCVHACLTIEIAEGQRLRRDFVSGPGGGLWCVDGVCGPSE